MLAGSSSRRVVVTGMGAVTNLGHDAVSTWAGMREGRSGIHSIESEFIKQYIDSWDVTIAGEVRNWDPCGGPIPALEFREAKRLDRVTQLGMGAAVEAVRDSGIDFSKENPENCGVVVGSGVGGIMTIEDGMYTLVQRGPDRLSPFTVPRLMVNATTGNISIRFGLKGPAAAHATACASSGHAIADAAHMIQRGWADVMVSGGTEAAVSPLCMGAFMVMKALSSSRNDAPDKASRPFDKNRDGFVLSEGAAMFVLESEEHAKARGARIYGELIGTGNSSDAGHITAPDAAGDGAGRSMKMALRDARLNTSDIGYVNAHGTGTVANEQSETEALRRVFGQDLAGLAVSSTKPIHGHALGAVGAIEMIVAINALRERIAPPTINFLGVDDKLGIDPVGNVARPFSGDAVMSNSFAFGGINASLVARRYAG